jgi:hypothetical protein
MKRNSGGRTKPKRLRSPVGRAVSADDKAQCAQTRDRLGYRRACQAEMLGQLARAQTTDRDVHQQVGILPGNASAARSFRRMSQVAGVMRCVGNHAALSRQRRHGSCSQCAEKRNCSSNELFGRCGKAQLPRSRQTTNSVRLVSTGKAIEEPIGTPADNEASIYMRDGDSAACRRQAPQGILRQPAQDQEARGWRGSRQPRRVRRLEPYS